MQTTGQQSTETAPDAGNRAGVLRAAVVMATGGVVFMVPVIGFPGIHANFETDPAARLAGLEAHWTNYLVGSVLLSLGWLVMGIGLLLLCRRLAELEAGRPATILRVAGPVLLVAFLVLAAVYVVPEAWSMTPAEWAASADEAEPAWMSVGQLAVVSTILVGWITVSAIIARSVHWPTWLGVAFGALGLATVVTQLPLFAAIGAIVLGTTVWRRSRRATTTSPAPA